jgi:hypothetical protein
MGGKKKQQPDGIAARGGAVADGSCIFASSSRRFSTPR